MTRMSFLSGALALALGACGGGGGNPFDVADTTTDPVTDPEEGTSVIPEAISNSLTAFSFDGTTLTVTGLSLDEEAEAATYRRRTALDILGPDGTTAYQAFTAQDDPLDEHTTAYVRTISDVTAALAVTGGQFTYYDGGARYTRNGDYDPVEVSESNDTGLVSYAGSYVGLSNVNGPTGDLAPTVGSPPTAILPSQASLVTGSIFINVDFVDNELKGVVYDRSVTVIDRDGNSQVETPPNLILVPTTVSDEGTFAGGVEIPGRIVVGEYGGILGGEDSEAIAGGLLVNEHFDDGRQGEEEYGIFVLGQCNTSASTDPALCASGAAE